MLHHDILDLFALGYMLNIIQNVMGICFAFLFCRSLRSGVFLNFELSPTARSNTHLSPTKAWSDGLFTLRALIFCFRFRYWAMRQRFILDFRALAVEIS